MTCWIPADDRARHVRQPACSENTPGWPDWAVISITEPYGAFGEAKRMEVWHAVLRVRFHDVDPALGCDEPHEVMNKQHAMEIVQFVRAVAPHVQGILVHCQAGMSRSGAVAKWIAEEYGLQFNQHSSRHNRHVLQLLSEAESSKQ